MHTTGGSIVNSQSLKQRSDMWDSLLRIQTLPRDWYGGDAWDVVVEAYANSSIDPDSYRKGSIRRMDELGPEPKSDPEKNDFEDQLRLEISGAPVPGREHIKTGLPDWF